LKALEEYEKADVVFPDFETDGIPLEKMGEFVTVLASTLPLSGESAGDQADPPPPRT
jgi:hypothetical protein